MPARVYNASSYRYGLNGQEKDTNIQSDHYTAEYWEYDSRSGRRWNLDPVTKSWQSGYSVLTDNPIWKIDPKGDDDYFNSDGTFSYRTKTGTAIRIITKQGTKLLSEIIPNSASNIKALVNVVAHYSPYAGIPGGTKVGISPNTLNRGSENASLAFTDNDGGIHVSAKNGINPSLNNYNNLISTLNHEEYHREANDPDKGRDYKFTDHLTVYDNQIDNQSFKNTDNEYKIQYAAKYTSYLLGALNVDEIDDKEFDNKVNFLNKKLSPYDVVIDVKRSSNPVPEVKIFGKDNRGAKVTTGDIQPRTNPQ